MVLTYRFSPFIKTFQIGSIDKTYINLINIKNKNKKNVDIRFGDPWPRLSLRNWSKILWSWSPPGDSNRSRAFFFLVPFSSGVRSGAAAAVTQYSSTLSEYVLISFLIHFVPIPRTYFFFTYYLPKEIPRQTRVPTTYTYNGHIM